MEHGEDASIQLAKQATMLTLVLAERGQALRTSPAPWYALFYLSSFSYLIFPSFNSYLGITRTSTLLDRHAECLKTDYAAHSRLLLSQTTRGYWAERSRCIYATEVEVMMLVGLTFGDRLGNVNDACRAEETPKTLSAVVHMNQEVNIVLLVLYERDGPYP